MSKQLLAESVAVRLAPDLLARVDALAAQLSTPWRPTTRSDVLRAALLKGLDVTEARPLEQATRHEGSASS